MFRRAQKLTGFFLLCVVFNTSLTAQYWYRSTGSLHELWINNLDVQKAKFHNKQQWVNVLEDNLSPDSFNVDWFLMNDFSPTKQSENKLPFYEYSGQLYHEKGEKYSLFVNPLLHLSYGSENGKTLYQNTRGVEFKGNLGGKNGLGFYSVITENQWSPPSYVDSFRNRNEVIPGQIWYKDFKGNAYDFIGARGYITFSPIKDFVSAQFGHDKNFIGFGERSLILSDFAAPYLFLKLNTKFGKYIEYQNIFSRYTNQSPLLGNTLFSHKFGATHRISAKLGKRTFLGISEMLVFDRNDSLGNNRYDLAYLNPIIFLRAVEIDAGSNDNVIMALDIKHHFPKFNSIAYGQFVLDEFSINFIRQRNNWWGNKFGYQLGAKYANKASQKSQLSVSAEYNRVRPYTYSHFNSSSNYSHFNQALAHPFGSNFHELFTRINWVPHLRTLRKQDAIIFDFSLSIARKGVDTIGGANFGGNILVDNSTRVQDFNNNIFQGREVNSVILNSTLSYRLGQASYFDISFGYRAGSQYIGAGTSLSIGYRLNTDFRNSSWY